jgi:hypothetical protein
MAFNAGVRAPQCDRKAADESKSEPGAAVRREATYLFP